MFLGLGVGSGKGRVNSALELGGTLNSWLPFSPVFLLIHLITPTPSLRDGLAFTYCKAVSFSTCYQVSQISAGNSPYAFWELYSSKIKVEYFGLETSNVI